VEIIPFMKLSMQDGSLQDVAGNEEMIKNLPDYPSTGNSLRYFKLWNISQTSKGMR
jgi:hypothetical protein